jgi:hypothetical protein
MEENILKGNFKVKNPVKIDNDQLKKPSVREQLRKKALSTLGGSMVYMERTDLTWEGDK